MKELLLRLNRLTGITFYLCGVHTNKMQTVHEGVVFDSDTPEWLQKFISGGNQLLVFEQNSQRKQYYMWQLDDSNVVVILDDAHFTSLTQILNKMLLSLPYSLSETGEATAGDLKTANNMLADLQQRLDKALTEKAAALDSVDKLTKENASLADMNKDQSIRLKDALAKNLELNHTLKEYKTTSAVPTATDSSITQLREENARFAEEIRQMQERYQKLSDKLNSIRQNTSTEYTDDNDTSKGLFKLINALNIVTETGDASMLDLKKLAMFVHVPVQAELERNPAAVKAIISKLLGMERSGQLTAFQTKKLNEVVL